MRLNDDESIHSTPVKQVCSFFFFPLLNHFSFAQDNHVSLQSVTLMVNTYDCSNTMRIKEDQNKHLNGERTSPRHTALLNQRNVGQVGSFGD